MAKATECQTDGAIYGLVITPKQITVDIELPEPIFWDTHELEILKANLHNAMELVMARYFKQL